MLAVFGSDGRLPEVRALQREYSELERGFTTTIPIDLPGTQWHKSMKVSSLSTVQYFISSLLPSLQLTFCAKCFWQMSAAVSEESFGNA